MRPWRAPLTGVLGEWLAATDDRFICREWDVERPDGTLEPRQAWVASIDSAWSSACREFGVPKGWGPKLIRHSVATILASKRVDGMELEILLGHRPVKKTTGRYTIFDPDYLLTVRQAIENLWGRVGRSLPISASPKFHPSGTPRVPSHDRIEGPKLLIYKGENGGRGKD